MPKTLAEVCVKDCEPCMPMDEGSVCKVVAVHDGDTMVCAFSRGGRFLKMNCRIRNIDTPELRSHNEAEKAAALCAKKVLEEFVLNQMVTLTHVGFDKYGSRTLSDVRLNSTGEDVAAHMLQHTDLCRPYDGGKKLPWSF